MASLPYIVDRRSLQDSLRYLAKKLQDDPSEAVVLGASIALVGLANRLDEDAANSSKVE